MEFSDNQLLQQIKSGNEDAYGTLFTRHRDSVYRYAYFILRDHEQAQDITQEVFFSLWNRRKYITTDNDSILPYLVVITKNECFDVIRAKEKLAEKQKGYASQQERFGINNTIETKELGQQLQSAINSITHPACRNIFVLSYVQGKKTAEIAEELQLSNGTVKNQVHRALKFLRERLETVN